MLIGDLTAPLSVRSPPDAYTGAWHLGNTTCDGSSGLPSFTGFESRLLTEGNSRQLAIAEVTGFRVPNNIRKPLVSNYVCTDAWSYSSEHEPTRPDA